MQEYLELGASPCEEACAQVGSENYHERAMKETHAYSRQLRRMFPLGHFSIKSFQHEYGSYHEVVIYFDPNDEVSTAIMHIVDGALPGYWDEIAKQELGL